MRELYDSSVVVASLLVDHSSHAFAYEALLAARRGEVEGAVAAHALAECFAVLTRMPGGVRLAPQVVLRALMSLSVEVVPLSTVDYREVLRRASDLGLVGGTVYDLLHVRAAEVWGARRVLTLNPKHFRRLVEGTAIEVVAP